MKVLYSTSATANGGREGSAKSEDGKLDVHSGHPEGTWRSWWQRHQPRTGFSQPAMPPAS